MEWLTGDRQRGVMFLVALAITLGVVIAEIVTARSILSWPLVTVLLGMLGLPSVIPGRNGRSDGPSDSTGRPPRPGSDVSVRPRGGGGGGQSFATAMALVTP